MIIKVSPLGGGGGGGTGSIAEEYEFTPSSGETIMVPASDALLINVLLWNEDPIDDLQIILPSLLAGRRVFVFSNSQVSQITFTSAEVGARVTNNVVAMNSNDLIVFNSVSVPNKIWGRVATS